MSTEKFEVTKIVAALEAAGITTNEQVINTCDSIGLISRTQNSTSDARHFQKSYGAKARKLHLRNYAPNIPLATFVEVGLEYHEYKKWSEYKNPLSYALLGMAVLTGREPTMPHGIFTKAGNSFGRHIETDWAKWFYANEFTHSTIPVKPIEAADTDLVVEYSVESSVVEQLPPPPAEVIIDMSTLPPVEVLKPVVDEQSTELAVIEPVAPAKAKRSRSKAKAKAAA